MPDLKAWMHSRSNHVICITLVALPFPVSFSSYLKCLLPLEISGRLLSTAIEPPALHQSAGQSQPTENAGFPDEALKNLDF
jgi:hypothetical protein